MALSPLAIALQGMGFTPSHVALHGLWVAAAPNTPGEVIPPTYKDIATRVFSGQATGAQNIIYARIGRRRTGPL